MPHQSRYYADRFRCVLQPDPWNSFIRRRRAWFRRRRGAGDFETSICFRIFGRDLDRSTRALSHSGPLRPDSSRPRGARHHQDAHTRAELIVSFFSSSGMRYERQAFPSRDPLSPPIPNENDRAFRGASGRHDGGPELSRSADRELVGHCRFEPRKEYRTIARRLQTRSSPGSRNQFIAADESRSGPDARLRFQRGAARADDAERSGSAPGSRRKDRLSAHASASSDRRKSNPQRRPLSP